MSRCLDTTSSEIKVLDLLGPDDSKRVHALGRAIDKAFSSNRRSRNKEQPLLAKPFGEVGCDAVEFLAHSSSYRLPFDGEIWSPRN